MGNKSVVGGGAAIVALVVAIAAASVLADASAAWSVSLIALTAFAGAVGYAINGRAAGLIIDNRNRISLSKMQALAWSLIVLSALLTAVIMRIRLGFDDPTDVELPNELLAAVGISATSLVAAPLVLSNKADQPTPVAKAQETAQKLGDHEPQHADPVGKIYARKQPSQARWLDLFRGDEVSNASSPDLSKVQQFLITVVVLLVYGAAVWKAFAGPELLTEEGDTPSFFAAFPPLSASMVWLIGISHAGYLAYKAAPHGASAPPPAKPGR